MYQTFTIPNNPYQLTCMWQRVFVQPSVEASLTIYEFSHFFLLDKYVLASLLKQTRQTIYELMSLYHWCTLFLLKTNKYH